ncbi:MAG: type IV pilin N-terminal domain-containing protein, partial [Thermoplasmata archaeon]|nr:type IV pilin N-terminal domain-containing protein [Thermoplasmata archaeon]
MSRVYRRKNAGVSEIIATILTLAITVVLFSTLFIWVDNLQGPLEPSYADFESTYATSGANGYLNITHYGGEVLESWYTEIRILNATTGALVARMSIVDGGIADGAWNIGETWQGVISSFPANSTMILEIMDVSKGVIVWNSRIGEDSDAVKPIVYFVSATPPVVAQGGSLELLARVYDPNGMSDITAVYANMTSVDGAPDIVNLTGNNGSWGLHYNVSITAVEGIHLVRFTAIDSTGNTANLATSVKVLNFSAMEPDLRFLTVNPIPVWEHDYFNVTARAEISSHILDPGNTTLGVSVLSNVQLGLGADRDMGSTSISNVFSTGVNGGVPVAGIQAPGVSGAFQVINLTVRAEDSIGYSMELNTTVTVVNQSVPIIAWGMADPTATILRNDTFRVMAYVIDQQNDVNWVGADLSDLNASWGVIDLNYTGGPYVSGDIDTSTMAFGNYTIWFNATDAQGHQAITYAIQIEIINPEPGEEERPPIITSIRIEYEPVRVGETFNVTATVIDLNGDLNHSDIILNVSELGIGLDEIQLVDTGDHVNFMAENISAPASRGYYNLSVWANDTSPLTNASHSKIILQVFPEVEILDYPDIALQTMLFSTMSPV